MIGRDDEINVLKKLLATQEAEFLTVVGRRRVGKTYLIRETYKDQVVFEATSIQNATKEEQLNNFFFALNTYYRDNIDTFDKPKSWIEAFEQLIHHLSHSKSKKKKVVFIDELPWMATARSGFLKGLSFFWNSWASKNKVVLATCGSAASWMIQKLFLNKGGLHNRVTKQIFLPPFTLKESKTYLDSRGIRLDQYQLSQLYMTIGGIPHYLKQVPKGKSVPQIISQLFFIKNATLKNEFKNLYESLFNDYEKYVKVIEACYTKWKGITQTEVIQLTGLPSGGSLTRILNDLEVSGFLQTTLPYNKTKKDTIYRLVDEFSIFYLKFASTGEYQNWQSISKTQGYKIWQGFAFENLCLKHIIKIKEKMGISGINTSEYSFLEKGNSTQKGTQIDLILDRDDRIINICEAKYYNKPFTITKDYVAKLEAKMEVFRMKIPTSKTLHLTMITTYGIKDNMYSNIVDSEVVLSDFFK